jgi:hypothetical protein
MKRVIVIMCMLFLSLSSFSQSTYRVYPVKKEVKLEMLRLTHDSVPMIATDSTLWFAPVANLTVLYFNKSDYKVGIVPGIGYGIHWKPNFYKGKSYLVSGQAFLQAGLENEEHPVFRIGPSVGVGVLGGVLSAGYSFNFVLNSPDTKSSGMWYVSTTLISF